MQVDLVTERGAALEPGDIEAVVTVALLSQWFDGSPRGYLKRNINTNIMQQGVGVDSPTVKDILSDNDEGATQAGSTRKSSWDWRSPRWVDCQPREDDGDVMVEQCIGYLRASILLPRFLVGVHDGPGE